jgi:hypothetical protein
VVEVYCRATGAVETLAPDLAIARLAG